MRDFMLPPRCRWDLRSGLLRSGRRWLFTDVSVQPIGPIFKGSSSPRRKPETSQPKRRSASRRLSACLAVVGLSNRCLKLKLGIALTLTIPHRRQRCYIHRMLWAVVGSQGQQASQSGCSVEKKMRGRGDTRIIPVQIKSGERKGKQTEKKG